MYHPRLGSGGIGAIGLRGGAIRGSISRWCLLKIFCTTDFIRRASKVDIKQVHAGREYSTNPYVARIILDFWVSWVCISGEFEGCAWEQSAMADINGWIGDWGLEAGR